METCRKAGQSTKGTALQLPLSLPNTAPLIPATEAAPA